MANQTLIDVSQLQGGAVKYNKYLSLLAVYTLADAAQVCRINLARLTGDYTYRTYERAGNMLRPYNPNEESIAAAKAGRITEKTLKLDIARIQTRDNRLSYQFLERKNIDFSPNTDAQMKDGKHPLEAQILFSLVSTMMEDIVDNLFFGVRVEGGTTANAAFDGFYTKIDAMEEAGEISEAKDNLFNSSDLAEPENDETDAFDNLVKWLQHASPKLLNRPCTLYIAPDAVLNVMRAYANKVRTIKDPTWEETLAAVKAKVMAPHLEAASHYCLGHGSRLILTGYVEDPQEKALMTLGINTQIAYPMVEVDWQPHDHNIFLYAIQAGIGSVVKSVNRNLFMTNEKINTHADMSGDYTPAEE